MNKVTVLIFVPIPGGWTLNENSLVTCFCFDDEMAFVFWWLIFLKSCVCVPPFLGNPMSDEQSNNDMCA